jgi:predicted secreted protein
MSISSAIAIYFVLWWVVLFMVLPFGVRSQTEAGETVLGTDPGAPVLPSMARKLLWTTIVSLILFAIGAWAYQAGYFNVERLSKLMRLPL